MESTFSAQFVALTALATALVGAAVAYFFLRPPGDEDRGTIIVRSGSVIFNHKKKWKYDENDKTRARPIEPNGAHVTGYKVQFEDPKKLKRADGSDCPALPMVGLKVDIEHKNGGTSTVTLYFAERQTGQDIKREPIVISTSDLGLDDDDRDLIHGKQKSEITQVTISDGQNLENKEVIVPRRQGDFGKIAIQPLR